MCIAFKHDNCKSVYLHYILQMALSFEKLLNDAKIMVTRLKDHDNSADIIIAQTQTLHNRINSMKQVHVYSILVKS